VSQVRGAQNRSDAFCLLRRPRSIALTKEPEPVLKRDRGRPRQVFSMSRNFLMPENLEEPSGKKGSLGICWPTTGNSVCRGGIEPGDKPDLRAPTYGRAVYATILKWASASNTPHWARVSKSEDYLIVVMPPSGEGGKSPSEDPDMLPGRARGGT